MQYDHPRIFIGLTDIAGYYSNLKYGFDSLGIKSVFINSEKNAFKYIITGNPEWANLVNKLFERIRYIPRSNLLFKGLRVLLKIILKCILFPFILSSYDVFLFGFNSTFLNYLDLPILKFFKKKIIYVFNGSDSRPPYLNGNFKNFSRNYIINLSKKKKKTINTIERYVDHLINIPPQAHFHERKFISALVLGLPFASKHPVPAKANQDRTKNVRILHAPSNPKIKGTKIIRKIIKHLKSANYQIEYKEVSNVSNSKVIELINWCDFVVDELYSDTPLAGFSTEAAYFGKPAIVGSYYATMIKSDIDSKNIPPSVFCHPDDVKKNIIDLIENKAKRESLGKKARYFVQNNWAPRIVASRYLKIINNDIPQEWICDPQNIDYIHGCGISEKKLKFIIKSLIKSKGPDSLFLNDKPHLVAKFIKFIN
jgi:glycosyltransferase involved in cell wall biosynthesis